MKRVHSKWLLPLVQLVLAFVCHIYGPHQYRVRAQQDRAVNNMEYLFQHSPALVERISQGINFPSLVLRYPLRNEDNAVYQHNSEYTLIWIAPKDLGFFVGIVLFWSCIGMALDGCLWRGASGIRTGKFRIAGLSCGLMFGVLNGAYAVHLITSRRLPERQVGAFGIVWFVGLVTYFGWRLARDSNAGRATPGR